MRLNLRNRLAAFAGLFFLALSSSYGAAYYVSKTGNDNGTGSKQDPFETIAKASSIMQSGDKCFIHEGTYGETIAPTTDNVSFFAMPDEKVVITGFDQVAGWTAHSGSIYVADITWNLGDENQVFFDGDMMTLARWPNKTNSDLFDLEMKWATGTNSSITHTEIPDQNWDEGGVVLFLGRNRWTSWRVPVTGSTAGRIDFDTLPTDWHFSGQHSPTNGGEFYLMNTLEALDAEGEWYIDRTAMKVYFWAPGNVDPSSGDVLVRRRTVLADLNGHEGVVLSNLEFFGGSIDLRDAESCVVKNCRIRYGSHTISTGRSFSLQRSSVTMNNNSIGNTVYRNDIQWGAGTGVLAEGTGNIVDNNYIGNFNYIGSYSSPVELRGPNYVMRNEIFNAGRDCVRMGGAEAELGYNNIHHSNLINDDCGGIYMCCGTFTGTRIHHNWIHDIYSRNDYISSYKGTGVYLDNSTVGVTVDHNVMWNLEWSCIQINWQGEDLEIYNNTLWANDGPNSAAMKRWVNGYDLINVPLYNTLANEGSFITTDEQNSCVLDLNATPFEDFASQNFVPIEGSCAIDAGREIPGFTEGFVGSAPDLGAYERGGYVWVPGPDWDLSDSLFDDHGPILHFPFGFTEDTLDLNSSNLTVGRPHVIYGSEDLIVWNELDTFVAPEDSIYTVDDLEFGNNRFFRIAEKIEIPQTVQFVSAALQLNQTEIKLTFDNRIGDPSNDIANFLVTGNNSPLQIQSVVRDESNWTVVTIGLASAAPDGQTLRLTYNPTIKGASGGTIIAIDNELIDASISNENLVAGKNGDGELGTAEGWTLHVDQGNTDISNKISVVQDPVHSGQYAIQAIYDGDAGTGLVNLRHGNGTFTAQAGATYEIEIWHYGKDLVGIDQYTTELSIYDAESGDVLLDKRAWKLSGPNQWNETTNRVSFGTSDAGDYVLGFRIYNGHFTIIVDDVSVVRVE